MTNPAQDQRGGSDHRSSSTLEIALKYARAGINLLPIRTDGSKSPAVDEWKHLQQQRNTENEIARSFSKTVGLAAIGGAVSGNLEDLDFDDVTAFEEWKQLIIEQLGPDFWSRLLIVRTPRPGYAVIVRCPSGVDKSQKLAMAPNPKFGEPGQPKTMCLIETRGEGSYFLLPGCPPACHPTGGTYDVVQGDFDHIPEITADEREVMWSCARSLCRLKRQEHRHPPSSIKTTGLILPGADYNTNGPKWEELLPTFGFTIHSRRGECIYWTRPGKSHGISASTNYGGHDCLYAFSTNLPFETDRGYRKFAVYTILAHNGDFKAAAEELARQGYGNRTNTPISDERTANSSPWERAQAAPEFIEKEDGEIDWIDYPLLAPGSITEIFSPRGIGKTHVALAKAAMLGALGCRVLLLDRDNSRREVRRRLKAWGASEAPALRVMTRNDVPPLTDVTSWSTFPFQDYDLIIIDSLDSSTEGVGEKDSSKPSRAIAPLLDIAHRANGPAILILGNTIKSAQHSRGSGVVEDRADICYEVRDATGFLSTGEKPWWEELPVAGADAWAQRSSRRRQQDVYRLAFIPSKFRVGEEPSPFIFEINLSTEPWTISEVTHEVEEAGITAGQRKSEDDQTRIQIAAGSLARHVAERAASGDAVLVDKQAVPFLQDKGLTRNDARDVIKQNKGRLWTIKQCMDQQGRPKVLVLIESVAGHKSEMTAEIDQSKTLQSSMSCNRDVSATPVNIERRKYEPLKPASAGDPSREGLFPPDVSVQPGWSEKI